MFKQLRTIWQRIRNLISTTEEYSNGEIVKRGVQVGTHHRRLVVLVSTESVGLIVRWLSSDWEAMCDAGWEVSLWLWLPSIAWGHGYYRSNSGYFRGEYYNYGYMFDEVGDVGWRTLTVTPWRKFWAAITARTHGTSDDFTPPDDMNDIPF